MPTVSVYITTKDRPALLVRAIHSVINQTYRDIEVIVIDDGSSCDNKGPVTELAQKTDIPVRFYRNEQSKGACFSRNLAIEVATGTYITGLDDDDEFVPHRIALMLQHYKPQYAFVASNDYLIKKNGDITYTKRPEVITIDILLDASENLVGNQVLTEKAKLQQIGGFDAGFPAFQDFDTYYRLVKQFGSGYVLSDKLQNIYRNDNVIKISTLHNQFFGIIRFYLKHRNDMSSQQRKRFILRYRLMKAKILGLKGSKANLWGVLFHSGKNSLKNNLLMYLKHYSSIYRKEFS